MRYTRQILALLALAAGWMVLVADSAPDPCPDFDTRADFNVQYEFQTNCMGEPASGLLNLHNNHESFCDWSNVNKEGETWVGTSTLDPIKDQGLNVLGVTIIYKHPADKLIPVGFHFQIKGKPVGVLSNPDTTVPTFVCKDSRTHETLAVNKDYLCENKENPSETCELKLTYQPRE